MSDHKEEASAAAAPAAAAGGGGMKAMLPLIISVVLMPVLAYAMTAFVLVPQLKSATGAPAPAAGHGEEVVEADAHGAEPAASGHGAAPAGHGAPAAAGKGATKFPLEKLIVNLSGTSGTRYLMTSLTLVGEKKNFASVIEENKDKILDVTTGALNAKTIPDLEKPGARNQIRSELLTVINSALGSDMVKEIYITEMAIQ
jgi:flagellar basal body-associated protein FliL